MFGNDYRYDGEHVDVVQQYPETGLVTIRKPGGTETTVDTADLEVEYGD